MFQHIRGQDFVLRKQNVSIPFDETPPYQYLELLQKLFWMYVLQIDAKVSISSFQNWVR